MTTIKKNDKYADFDNLTKTIYKIIEKVPDSDENKLLLHELNKICNKIIYTAPEILQIRWTELHTLLSDKIKIVTDCAPWMNEIQQIWNDAIHNSDE